MKTRIFGTALALALIAPLAGCSNTLSGAKQDAGKDTQAVSTAASNAAQATKQATTQVASDVKQTADDAKAATVLTPAIKLAIIRDPVLNDTRNLVNVNTEATTVHLRGHVVSADMKQRATEDAQVVLDKHHATQQISNELAVSGGS